MNIIGIYDGHNASVAYFKNNKIEFAINEERIVKKKNQSGFPINSLEYLFKNYKITNKNLDYVAIAGTYRDDLNDLLYEWSYNFNIDEHKRLMQDFWHNKLNNKKYDKNYVKNNTKKYQKSFYLQYLNKSKKFKINDKDLINNLIKDIFSQKFGIYKKKIRFIDHHFCHLLHAYWSNRNLDLSKKYIGVTMDGFGDGLNQTVWQIYKNQFTKIASTNQNEIARIYRMSTLYLNMKPLEHEYKIMGLAPYSNNSKFSKELEKKLSSIIKLKNFLFVHNKRPKDLYQHLSNIYSNYRFDIIAAGLQSFVEKSLVEMFNKIIFKTKINNFVFGGGTAMNTKANMEISKLPKLQSIFVPGAPDDQGTAFGACYAVAMENNIKIKPNDNYYLGNSVDHKKIKNLSKNKFKIYKNISNTKLIDLLIQDNIIAICNGRMEFGARALGNRSIIANPFNPSIVERINKSIKNRDFWMPFAGTIPYELSKKFLKNKNNLDGSFMTLCFDSIHNEKYISACHPYDKTIRAQILQRDQNKWYYDLIMSFYEITNIPVILNTSLNIHGKPIVMDEKDAIELLKKTSINYLFLDGILIKKN
tara:strand:- start:15630 stop:17390 length:1761 start_codon:yes stop_codon:yes gene_type:complete